MVKCPNCGEKIDGKVDKCPYCNTQIELSNKRKKKKIVFVALGIVVVVVAGVSAYFGTSNMRAYNRAVKMANDNQYEEAINIFNDIIEYKDSKEQVDDCFYQIGLENISNSNWDEAKDVFDQIENAELKEEGLDKVEYCKAIEFINEGKYEEAIEILTPLSEKQYEDSASQIQLCNYNIGKKYFDDGLYSQALLYLEDLNYQDSEEMVSTIRSATYALCNFTQRYNDMMDNLNEMGYPAMGFPESDIIASNETEKTLVSGGQLSFNNGNDLPNVQQEIVNFTYYVPNFDVNDSFDMQCMMADVYAIIAGMTPDADYSTVDQIMSQIWSVEPVVIDNIEYTNYSMSDMVGIVGRKIN